MALTRPRYGQLNTATIAAADPITVLNQGSTSANVDVGFLFNRANGLVPNVSIFWNESTQNVVTAFTSNTGVTNSNIEVSSYANIRVGVATVDTISTSNLIWAGNSQPINLSSDSTSSTVPPAHPRTGDTWYDTANGIWYVYEITDGGNYWIDLYSPTLSPSTPSSQGLTGDVVFSGNVTPSADATYSLGANGLAWNEVNADKLSTPFTISSSTFAYANVALTDNAIDSLSTILYRSAKYVVQLTASSGYQTSEVLIIHNGTDSFVTEYGTIYTNSRLGTFSSNIVGGNVFLYVSPTVANTEVIVSRNTIADPNAVPQNLLTSTGFLDLANASGSADLNA